MNSILNNIRRIFTDDGRNDRDFTDQESRLQTARAALLVEADELKRAAESLADIIKARA
ncbi:hypothetical protein JQ574_22695 [Bradyrhizobium sp. AUGA SZCCT0158]|uniref:hypothetical protein n=1 Tax=Bradyrhizobium sp. AUGA SZCCT0158 TaxID=2807661 RepID=UPI001BAB5D91|nr:hypothetical protein [Bradyrhizobium sp. AUGA SZCCT0158]MBR1198809.1 hypothetical protein [Bradyrhizobium sp. AUGA SZCCT0158]